MPSPYRPSRQYPGQAYTLRHAAQNGQLVVVRCGHCLRQTNFLANDLVTLVDPAADALEPPFPCSKCGKWSHVTVRVHLPAPADYGHLLIRRPAAIVVSQRWRTVRLGD